VEGWHVTPRKCSVSLYGRVGLGRTKEESDRPSENPDYREETGAAELEVKRESSGAS